MRGWTAGAVYLCGLGYSTAIVILVGTWLVQTRAEWPTIRGTEPILSSWPNPTQPTEPRAVKAAPHRSVRSSVSRINSFGETGLVSALGAAHPNTKEAGHEEVALFPMMPADMNLLQEKSTDGERVASAPKAINRAADRAFNSATRAPRLVGLVNAGRDLGAMRPSHLRVTLGRDRDFEREPQASMRSDRSAHSATKPSSDYSAESLAALSRGVHHEPGSAHLPGGRAGAYLYEVTAYSHGCIMPVVGAEGHARRAANGRWPVADVTVAADTRLHPFGTEVLIEGLGFRTVGDRGHAIKGRRLDLFVDSCREARKFGRRWMAVSTVPPESTRFGSLGSAR